MKIKCKDLYEALQQTNKSLTDMGLDIQNIGCGTANCLVTYEHLRLKESYMELYNADVSMKEVDLDEIQKQIAACMRECVTF
ncbi:hypothetical protein [Brevibacillus laterosporus]|uniref:hypothetical protein n=1 Tax=Brevibacillus laterosporus TaxID=1465 RepID=UPI000CE352B8|nr:hypothetical protein [Brevibacillus laterosporus]MBG9773003.1 hypothetical protein [Brevibacillus laterosporus]MED1666950.1 hypothetical protein [Brevibacillus laterosporus]MED1667884.1 hypothetical protein [Brevibacillus laterosporus]MED1716802.1 hypothetical protein [Brevibacillus laterosporus]PPA89920.1 hypothetical protein C4A76_00110 [Brevibacillus laterosporus]